MADDRIVISSEPGVTPDEIARRSFPVVFRGYDQDQVRRFLKKVGDELIEAREREKELGRALDEARGQLAHPELDEATLTAALGEETTRILRSAREAAADMRTKAEERVARMVQEADGRGERLRVVAAPPDDSDLAVYTAPPPEEPMAAPEPSAEREVGPEAAPGAPEVTAAPPSFVPPEPEPAEAPRPSLVRLQPFDEEEGVRIIGPSSQVAPKAEAAPAPVDPTPAVPEAEEQHASVDNLFARLREERQGAVIKAQQVL